MIRVISMAQIADMTVFHTAITPTILSAVICTVHVETTVTTTEQLL